MISIIPQFSLNASPPRLIYLAKLTGHQREQGKF